MADKGDEKEGEEDKEKPEHFNRMTYLVATIGTDIVRQLFVKDIPTGQSVGTFLKNSEKTIKSLTTKHVFNNYQLYLLNSSQPDVNRFDMSLLYILVCHLSNMTPPSGGWHQAMPLLHDTSPAALLMKLRIARNDFIADSANGKMTKSSFEKHWSAISDIVIDLAGAISQDEKRAVKEKVDEMRQKPIGDEVYKQNTLVMWALQDRVGVISSELDELSKIIATQETRTGSIDTTVHALQGQMATLLNEMATLDTKIATQGGQTVTSVQTLTDQIATIDTKMATQETRTGSIDTTVHALQGQMATQLNEMATLNTKMATQETRTGSIDTTVHALQGQMATLLNEMATLNTKMATQETRTGSIDTTVHALQGQTATILNEIATLNTNIATQGGQTVTSVQTLTDQIATLDTKMATQDNRAASIDTTVHALQGQTATILNEIATLNTNIATQGGQTVTSVQTLTDQIATLDTKTKQPETDKGKNMEDDIKILCKQLEEENDEIITAAAYKQKDDDKYWMTILTKKEPDKDASMKLQRKYKLLGNKDLEFEIRLMHTEGKYVTKSKDFLNSFKDKETIEKISVAKQVIAKQHDLLKNNPNITCLSYSPVRSVGYGTSHQRIIKQHCIVAVVNVKFGDRRVPLGCGGIPTDIGGFKTDCREGFVRLLNRDIPPDEFHETLNMGCAISTDRQLGSIGPFFDHKDGSVGFVTSLHVVLPEHVTAEREIQYNTLQRPICQPNFDLETTRIGKVDNVLYNSGGANTNISGYEVAVIKLTERHPVDGGFPLDVNYAQGSQMEYTSANTTFATGGNAEIEMFGAVSGYRRGVWVGDAHMIDTMAEQLPIKLYSQIGVCTDLASFGDYGDSGSTVFINDGGILKAIGILTGYVYDGSWTSIVTPIQPICETMSNDGWKLKAFQPQQQMGNIPPMYEPMQIQFPPQQQMDDIPA